MSMRIFELLFLNGKEIPKIGKNGAKLTIKGGVKQLFLWMPNFFPTFFEITEQIMNFSG